MSGGEKLDAHRPEGERAAGARNEEAAALAALVAQWHQLMGARTPAPGPAPVRVRAASAADRIIEDVAQAIGQACLPPGGRCEFSIDLGGPGVVDGRLTLAASGRIDVALRPRLRPTAELLAARRDRLQRRASAAAGVPLFVDVEEP
jgi:hypothetical protein